MLPQKQSTPCFGDQPFGIFDNLLIFSIGLQFLMEKHHLFLQSLSMPRVIEHFHSLDQHLCKFIGTKESGCIRKKNSTPTGLSWYTNMATISSFWNTNMATVTSCEYALYNILVLFGNDALVLRYFQEIIFSFIKNKQK